MKISKLVALLQEAQNEHGDMRVHYYANGSEHSPNEVKLVKAGAPVYAGLGTGPHKFEPDRIVITGHTLTG